MSKSLLQTVNTSTQTLAEGGLINPGTVIRRYGCNIRLNNNSIELIDNGYFKIDATITVEPTAVGNVSVALYEDGIVIPGTLVSGYAAAASAPVTLPIVATVRHNCCCNNTSSITAALVAGAGDVTNVSIRAEKS